MFAIVVTVTLFCLVTGAKLPVDTTSACPVKSSLIKFDDITNTTNSSSYPPVPNGYGGLNWQNVLVVNGINDSNPNTGYRAGVVSPPYLAFDGNGGPMSITSINASTFTIHSFYSCAAWYDDVTLVMTGLRSRTTLYTKTVPLLMLNRTLIELNWEGVDEVYFNSICETCCDAKHFTMDNLCITV